MERAGREAGKRGERLAREHGFLKDRSIWVREGLVCPAYSADMSRV